MSPFFDIVDLEVSLVLGFGCQLIGSPARMSATLYSVWPWGAAGLDAFDELNSATSKGRVLFFGGVCDHKPWPYLWPSALILLCLFWSQRQNIHAKKWGGEIRLTSICQLPPFSPLLSFMTVTPLHHILPFYCSLSPLLSLATCLSPPLPPILLSLGLSFELSLLSLSFPYITPSHPSLSASDIPL